MRTLPAVFLCAALLLPACAPRFSSTGELPALPQASPQVEADSQPAPQTRAEIRFALIGAPREANVWAAFDETGASYADYAPRFDLYPRLYHLVPPDFSFQPLAAQGAPSALSEADGTYFAVVHLRPDLKWSDGSPFTAEDVVFTVQTALAFELGYDWRAAYSPEVLERAETLDPYAVQFVFKRKPNVGEWQYGALQGRLVQKKFWQPRVAAAEALLPPPEFRAEIDLARARLAQAQFDVDNLSAQLRAIRETGGGSRDLEIQLAQRKLQLGYAKNNLSKALERYQSALQSARQKLYETNGVGEPTLGVWEFQSKNARAWVNRANPAFPFGKPRFERAVYLFFKTENEALAAFEKNEADFILAPGGISRAPAGTRLNPSSSARFLVFHPAKPQFADRAFRAALSCLIDREELVRDVLGGKAFPLEGFIVSPQWRSPSLSAPCAGMSRSQRTEAAAQMLKDAGYSWKARPAAERAGRGLKTPQGETFPPMVLLAPNAETDPQRYAAAQYIAQRAQYLGIPLSVRPAAAEEILYAVFSSQKFDAALLGWRLGEYPQYVCDWFGGGDPYLYAGDSFAAPCAALSAEADLDSARRAFQRLEANLASEQAFIPLFLAARAEAYRGLAYPSAALLNGWSGLYGAPAYAMPAP